MIRPTTIFPTQARARGFTLIETALATIIVGVGIVATMRLFASCTYENHVADQMSVSMMLATNVQEAMGGLPFADPGLGTTSFGDEAGETLATYDDVDDFDGLTFSPPIDSQRATIPAMSQYSQVVSIWPVDPNKVCLNSNESAPDIAKTASGPYTGAVRVRVRILYRATPNDVPAEVYRASWVRMDN